MDKSDILKGIYGLFGILGVFLQVFTGMQSSYIILLMLISLDTFTGISAALRYKRFSSTGLRKFIRKVITYTLSMITVRLLEIVLNPIIITTMLSKIIIAFLAITESLSILENLTLLGVPLPPNILFLLIKRLKVPILDTMLDNSNSKNRDFYDMDYILNSQIDNISDKYIKSFLEIRYDAFKSLINQIKLIKETNKNSDILLYTVISYVELAFNRSNKEYAKKNIPINYIEIFLKNNKSTTFDLLKKLKITCCCSEKTIKEKKTKLVDDIIVIMYQSIFEARKNI
ncbi:phage holin family protein [Clostridium sp.]|uniref:phage holin family protein n=1 Tax=Clostridium sp. TaxID=1506 RepID=UPI003D6D3ACB